MEILQNSCSTEYHVDFMIKIFEKKTVTKFNFSKVANLWSATLIRTGHFHRLIRLALI